STGASPTDKVTTASARYSVGATLVRSAENTRARPNTGTDSPSGPVSSSAASAGRSRNISTSTSCRYDSMTMTLTAPTDTNDTPRIYTTHIPRSYWQDHGTGHVGTSRIPVGYSQ